MIAKIMFGVGLFLFLLGIVLLFNATSVCIAVLNIITIIGGAFTILCSMSVARSIRLINKTKGKADEH